VTIQQPSYSVTTGGSVTLVKLLHMLLRGWIDIRFDDGTQILIH
jgi:hypothetical protein